MSQTARLAPPMNYYSRADYLKQLEERNRPTSPKNVGATAWLAGMTRDEYTAQLAAAGYKPDPHKLYLHEQDVKRDTVAAMEAMALRTYDGVANESIPKGVRVSALDPKATALENMPHLGYARVGAVMRKNGDGSTTPVVIFAANFRADPKVINGKQVFENIRPQLDGVKNEPMLFAFALDANTMQPDKRFGKDGVLFRLSDVSKVAEACAKIAPPRPRNNAPTAQPTHGLRQAPKPEGRTFG